MASKAECQSEDFNEDEKFVKRFVYDILAYTLTKCGLPENCLPTTDCAENVYHHADIVKVAGVSALRISLVMRDKWKRMFVSRRNSSGFSNDKVLDFLVGLVTCCPLSRSDVAQSLVELLLASGNEIMMFFHHESIDINFNIVLKSITVYIIGLIGLNGNGSKKIEELFDIFDDISEYTEWITNFITQFAIPYGSKDDVSDLFFQNVRKRFKVNLNKLKNSLGFLPHDLFLVIALEESEKLSDLISNDSESPEQPKLNTNSDIGAEGRKSLGSLSTQPENVSARFGQDKQISEISSKLEIEYDFTKLSLDAEESSQEIHGTLKRKTPQNKNGKDKKKES